MFTPSEQDEIKHLSARQRKKLKRMEKIQNVDTADNKPGTFSAVMKAVVFVFVHIGYLILLPTEIFTKTALVFANKLKSVDLLDFISRFKKVRINPIAIEVVSEPDPSRIPEFQTHTDISTTLEDEYIEIDLTVVVVLSRKLVTVAKALIVGVVRLLMFPLKWAKQKAAQRPTPLKKSPKSLPIEQESYEDLVVAETVVPKQKKQGLFLNNFFMFVFGILFACGFVFAPYEAYRWYRELPNPSILAYEATKVSKPTRIYDRHNRLLYEIYPERETEPVALDKISKDLSNATIAVEDASFYSHPGYRLDSMLLAVKASLLDETLQGASTITQQLIKNVLLSPERTITRKIKEVVLAVLVENKYSKKQILEMYLNNISYGGNAWGIQAAAQKFFGKNAVELNLAEASLLAGLPSAPSVYSPLDANGLELSKERQKYVLDRMVYLGNITQGQATAAAAEPINIATKSEFIQAPHFVAYVRQQLEKKFGKRYVDFGGLTVHTTLDLDLQDKAQEIVRQEVAVSSYLNFSNGAAVVLAPKTGEILAYVGSIDYYKEGWGAFDVVSAMRQPGSSIKPVTYALALDRGYTAASLIDDSPVTFQTGVESYRPVNYDGKYHGLVTLRMALANSYNIPAVKLVKAVTADEMVTLGSRMGLMGWKAGDGSYGLSVTLGGKETRLLDLANTYGTFARMGVYKAVTPFLSVTDVSGYEIYNLDDTQTGEQAVKPEVSYIISNILADNAARMPAFGTRNNLTIAGHTVSVKTGTTDLKRDNWTVGYTPSFVVGVWVGNNDNRPMNPYLASGLSGAAPIWNKIMQLALMDTADEKFDMPEGVFVKVDPLCGNAIEIFIKGSNVPTRLCAPKVDKDKEEKKNKKKRND